MLEGQIEELKQEKELGEASEKKLRKELEVRMSLLLYYNVITAY